MSIEKVRAYFRARNMEDRILEFDVSSATVELAAKALNCDGSLIAKTLSFAVHDGVVYKYKMRFGVKAKMLSAEDAENLIGHAVGGVCPFAVNESVQVFLDESLKRFEYVYPACGSSNSAIKLTIPDLEKYADHFAGWVDVCKLK